MKWNLGEAVAIVLNAQADVDGAKWCKLFPFGVYHRKDFPDGRVEFNRQYLGTMLSNWKRSGSPELPVDYFHRGPSGEDPMVSNEDKVASGWIKQLELRDDGLWALIKWTDDARALILAEKLKYLSPYFGHNGMDRKTGKLQGPTLAGAGLLNDPFLQDLPPVAASDTMRSVSRADLGSDFREHEVRTLEQLLKLLGLAAGASRAEVQAKLSELGFKLDDDGGGDSVMSAFKKFKTAVCSALGLDGDASDDAVMSMVKKLAKYASDGDGDADDAPAKKKMSAQIDELGDMLKLSKEENTKLSARLQKLEAEKLKSEIDGVVSKLEAGHHIIAAQKDKVRAYAEKTSPKEAFEFFSQFTAVPKGERGSSHAEPPAETPAEAYAKLTELAKERAKTEKISLSAARSAVYADPQNDALVALANRNGSSERRN